jgi:hypothetical protein
MEEYIRVTINIPYWEERSKFYRMNTGKELPSWLNMFKDNNNVDTSK